MNQVHSLEHAINLAKHMTISDALWKADQNRGKKLLDLLEDPKENIDTIKSYKEHFEDKSHVPRVANYFRNYEQGIHIYRDMANALKGLIQELKTD